MTDPEVANRTRELANYVNLLPQFAIRAMATLDIAALIADGTDDVGQLAERTGTQPQVLGRLLRYLATRGFLVRSGPDTYDLTPHGRVLADDPYFRAQISAGSPMHRMEQAYARLLDTMRTGEAAYRTVHGRTLYEDIDADTGLTAASAAALASRSTRVAADLSRSYPWDRVRSVVDVGGADGVTLIEVLSAHPHLSGTVIDLPQSVALAEKAGEAAGLADRLTVQAGSFFDPLPPGHDVYVLASILIDWTDDDAIAILSRCRDACGPGGQVVIVDWIRHPRSDDALMSHVDLHQLVLVGGQVRTVDEVSALAAKADLTTTSSLSLESSVTMVVLEP